MTNPPAPPAILNDPEAPGNSRFRLMLQTLAREIVVKLEDIDAILTRKGITNIQYEKILKNPYYVRIFKEYETAWNAADNAEARSRLQAAYLFEQALPGYFVRVTDRTEPLPAVTEAMKLLARVAGIGEARSANAGDGGKFVISINLGGGHKIEHEVTKTIDITPQHAEKSHGPSNG